MQPKACMPPSVPNESIQIGHFLFASTVFAVAVSSLATRRARDRACSSSSSEFVKSISSRVLLRPPASAAVPGAATLLLLAGSGVAHIEQTVAFGSSSMRVHAVQERAMLCVAVELVAPSASLPSASIKAGRRGRIVGELKRLVEHLHQSGPSKTRPCLARAGACAAFD